MGQFHGRGTEKRDILQMTARLNDILKVVPVIVPEPLPSFDDAVSGLVAELVEAGDLEAGLTGPAIQAVIEREQMASTAMMEIGISIPHARLDGVHGIVAALAVSPAAVYYAHAAVPITIMSLVLSASSMSGDYLNFLSALSLMLQSPTARTTLQRATSAEEVLAYLRTQPRFR